MTPLPVVVPLALAHLGDVEQVRTRYPVLLLPFQEDPVAQPCAPLIDLLPDLAAGIGAQVPGAAILRDNLPRLEAWLRAQAREAGGPIDAATAFRVAAEAMVAALGLRSEPARDLGQALEALIGRIPPGTRLLPYTPTAHLHLLVHVAGPARRAARAAWREQLHQARNGLADLLLVEKARDGGQGSDPGERVSSSAGAMAGTFLDPAALARVVGPARGGQRMEAGRRARLEGLLAVLDEALAAPEGPLVVLVGGAVDAPGALSVASTDPCADASARFDALAAALLRVAVALRVARLELARAYDPAVHDARVAGLSWAHLGPEELAVLPAVVAVESADRVVSDDLVGLTRVLGSGRPVQLVVEVQSTRNPGAGAAPLAGFRVELGQLGMALRQVFVQQSTPAEAVHCARGFRQALRGQRPALHLLCTGWLPDGTAMAPDPWLAASSAVEGRAHPLFRYDPDAGESWADCLDAAANPSPAADWAGANGSAPYTFADHALLDPSLAGELREPSAEEAARLLPLHEWLALDEEEAGDRVPALTVSDDGQARPRVPSPMLLFACRDRLRAWRSLRELAGYANPHARRAAQEARAEAEAAARVAASEAAAAAARARQEAQGAAGAAERADAALVAAEAAHAAQEATLAGLRPRLAALRER